MPTPDDPVEQRDRARGLAAALEDEIARVLAIHDESFLGQCRSCVEAYPCRTRRILSGVDQ